ncbi:Multidrug efflux pump subunit AcrB [Caballeronia sp. SBC1]|uniref:multidrug efflux RND transporter permease subunit n=1 Tax=unclassified Caballeronia TaxID=2646786 RepID=UPI0013E19197|nr:MULTISPECIES: multidrug efflux RND transporter permease subunit [unclassified Caballeronia]QIE23216.1 Multidrug efflux pump subunit AcrB [Caballeronia sp. SBC2]QIN61110.1 Multidrug efflux pump subunit AcrB [Caballeronia sp. SBC1]
MPSFFIDRPVFAWIVALAIFVAGGLVTPFLPVAQYPRLTPPRIVIDAMYPGASPESVDNTVASVIEESLDGAEGLQYYETTSDSLGELEIAATFSAGTNPDIAMVDVQNRMKQIESRLPQQVVQQGISVFKSTGTFLMLVALTSTDGQRDSVELSDYVNRTLLRDLKRAPGVGSAELWDAGEALRVWIDPMKLREFNLAAADVTQAIAAQNATVTAGTLGDVPFVTGQQLTASVTVRGQLISPAEFGEIVLKARTDGSAVRLKDVARVELGRDSYASFSRLNGKPAATVGIRLSPQGNAMETSAAIRAKLAELSRSLPPGVAVEIPFDSSKFVHVALHEVALTLFEAVLLVFLVMWLFLRDLRYALVPTVVIPVALTGALLALYVLGMSINVFTMFAMVLAIGILVDDAIVVVENVDRVMREEGLAPRAATRRAMQQMGSAIVGITAVLTAVFVPMAFFPGSVGGIYRQFTVAMIASILVSAFTALSLTPALCANLLKAPPRSAVRHGAHGASHGSHAASGRSFGFTAAFDWTSRGYRGLVARVLRRAGPMFAVYLVLAGACAALYLHMPGGFLPQEDQAQLQVMVQLPAGATQARTLAVVEQAEAILKREPAVANVTTVVGWSFQGSGQNVAMCFVDLKDWAARDTDAATLRDTLNRSLSKIMDGDVAAQMPPSVPGMGHSEGFVMRLEDRGGIGIAALSAAREQLFEQARNNPAFADVHSEALPDAPRIVLDVDRAKAYALGVSFDKIGDALGNTFGSSYIDDFPSGGRMRRVMVAADAPSRMTEDSLMNLSVRNAAGQMVPLSSVAALHWTTGPTVLTRYNGSPSLDVSGRPANGTSSGAAMAEMERLAQALPVGVGYDWTDSALEETRAARLTPILIGLSLLAVFMALAALYESWTIPLAVLTIVPLGVIGAVIAMLLRGMPNDVYFKVGMITVIGLSAKNAILIVQFARTLYADGAPLPDAIVAAASARFRPIVMTSAAFLLGVVPLLVSSGAGAESRRSIGTGVFGGAITATVLGLVFTPLAFYIVVSGQRFIQSRVKSMTREKVTANVESEAPGGDVQGSQEG